MKKIVNNAVIGSCGECKYYEATPDYIGGTNTDYFCNLSKKTMDIVSGEDLDYYCPLKDVEVIKEGGFYFSECCEVRLKRNSEDIDHIIIVRKAKGE